MKTFLDMSIIKVGEEVIGASGCGFTFACSTGPLQSRT